MEQLVETFCSHLLGLKGWHGHETFRAFFHRALHSTSHGATSNICGWSDRPKVQSEILIPEEGDGEVDDKWRTREKEARDTHSEICQTSNLRNYSGHLDQR